MLREGNPGRLMWRNPWQASWQASWLSGGMRGVNLGGLRVGLAQ